MIVDCNVAQPWFDHIASGVKTVEGRLNKGKFAALKAGQVLSINDGALRCHVVKVEAFASFRHLLEQEGVRRVLPGVADVAEGCAVYQQFYSAEAQSEHGVVALHLSVVDVAAEALFAAADRLASAPSRRAWSEAHHRTEWTVRSGLLARVAKRGMMLSFLDHLTCKKLDRLAKAKDVLRSF